MTLKTLSIVSKKLKIGAGVIQILIGLLCAFLGIYFSLEHMSIGFGSIILWLAALYNCWSGAKLIYEARRAT